MTVTGALVAVISRKVRALIAEVRSLVTTAKTLEKSYVVGAEVEIRGIKRKLAQDVAELREGLIESINKL